MAEIARMWATIGADTSGLDRGLTSSKEKLSLFGQGFQQLQSMATAALVAVGAAISGAAAVVAKTGIEFDALKESANTAFTTMLGSGQAAQAMLNELQSFAQKTPFEFPDLITASQRLMAMGFAAEDVIPTLTAIGDAVAAMGGSSAEVDRVTLAIGQMNAKGKVSAEEMRQLTEAGIPAWQMLADKLGITVAQAMDQVSGKTKKMGEAGGLAWQTMDDGTIKVLPKMRAVKDAMDDTAMSGVSASVGIAALTEGIEKRFGGMMNKQSQTWNGIISNIKDGFTQLSGTVMQPFFDMAKVGLERVAAAITAGTQALQKGYSLWEALDVAIANLTANSEPLMQIWDTIRGIGTAIRALTEPVISAIGHFVTWKDVIIALATSLGVALLAVLPVIVSALSPIIATVGTVTLAVVALRHAWDANFLGMRTAVQGWFSEVSKWFEKTGIWKGSWNETIYGANGIQPTIFRFITMSQNTIAHWVQWIYDHFEGMKNDVTRTVTNWRDILLSTFHEWIDPLATKVENWGIGVKNTFNHMVGYVMGDLQPWKHDVLAIWDEIEKWWTDNPQRWYNDAYNMVMGLWHGFQVGWYEFWDWLDPEFGRIGKRLREQYGIHSPSTVMAAIGSDLTQGLAQGISEGQTEVQGAVDGLSAVIDSATPKLRNYWLDLQNAQLAALKLASMPTLPPAPDLYKTPIGKPAASSVAPVGKERGPISGAAGQPQYASLSNTLFDLFGNTGGLKQIVDFATSAYSAITAPGQAQLQGSSAAYLGYKELTSGGVGGDQTGRVISAILALVNELQSRNADNKVSTKAILALVDTLKNQGGGSGLGDYVAQRTGLRAAL